MFNLGQRLILGCTLALCIMAGLVIAARGALATARAMASAVSPSESESRWIVQGCAAVTASQPTC